MFVNETKGIKIVFSILLKKTLSYKSSFVFFNGTIEFVFKIKNPFTANRCMRLRRYKFPSLIVNEGIEFEVYSNSLLKIFESLGWSGRFKSSWQLVESRSVNKVWIEIFGVLFSGLLRERTRWRCR